MTGWFIAIIIMAAVFFCIKQSHKFEQSRLGLPPQEPISDEQFCELMPEIPVQTALKVREVLADVSGWGREEIHPKTRIIEFD